jgi:hypothetical protein
MKAKVHKPMTCDQQQTMQGGYIYSDMVLFLQLAAKMLEVIVIVISQLICVISGTITEDKQTSLG